MQVEPDRLPKLKSSGSSTASTKTSRLVALAFVTASSAKVSVPTGCVPKLMCFGLTRTSRVAARAAGGMGARTPIPMMMLRNATIRFIFAPTSLEPGGGADSALAALLEPNRHLVFVVARIRIGGCRGDIGDHCGVPGDRQATGIGGSAHGHRHGGTGVERFWDGADKATLQIVKAADEQAYAAGNRVAGIRHGDRIGHDLTGLGGISIGHDTDSEICARLGGRGRRVAEKHQSADGQRERHRRHRPSATT